jgi:hypothetical protein
VGPISLQRIRRSLVFPKSSSCCFLGRVTQLIYILIGRYPFQLVNFNVTYVAYGSFRSSLHVDGGVCVWSWNRYVPPPAPFPPLSAYSSSQYLLYVLSDQSLTPIHLSGAGCHGSAQSQHRQSQSHCQLCRIVVVPPSVIVRRGIRGELESAASSDRSDGPERKGKSRQGGGDLGRRHAMLLATRNCQQQTLQLVAGDVAVRQSHRLSSQAAYRALH